MWTLKKDGREWVVSTDDEAETIQELRMTTAPEATEESAKRFFDIFVERLNASEDMKTAYSRAASQIKAERERIAIDEPSPENWPSLPTKRI